MSQTSSPRERNGSSCAATARSNIASALQVMAAELPDKAAILLPSSRGPVATRQYTTLTYAQLHASSDRVAAGLAAIGVKRGERAALMVPPSPELFALVFGLYKAGVIPVMIDPGIGIKRLGACLRQAEPTTFIGVPLAHALRVVLGWGRPALRSLITVGRRWFWGGVRYQQLLDAGDGGAEIAPTAPDDVAAILFTSGATGPPKGVVYRHRHFVAQVEMIRDAYMIKPGEVDLPTFPLFALFDPALGMTSVIPRMNFTRPARVDPREILGAAERFGATNMFGSPALVDTVSTHAALTGERAPSLRRIITAGAPVRPDILRRARAMIAEDGCVYTPYGATENLPVASIESREVLAETAAKSAEGAGVCVGRPDPRNHVAIIAITDAPIAAWHSGLALPVGEIGEITVRGPTTTDTYFGLPEATSLAKIRDGTEVRHRMGDAGYLDADGRLWYCGRIAHRLVVDGEAMFTLPVEGVFNAHPAVLRSAVVGVESGARVTPLVIWEKRRDAADDDATVEEQLQKLARQRQVTHRIDRFLRYPRTAGLPVDIRHNAKINRPALQRWAQRHLDTST